MEPAMQPLAISALAITIVMLIGVVTTLILTRKNGARGRAAAGRWHRHGSIPLAGAGLALAVISRANGQVPATRDITYSAATALTIAALACAVTGAMATTRRQRDGSGA
jgi:hypothetical protein